VDVVRRGVPLAVRGQGHSSFGQCLVADGIVVDMGGLASVGRVGADRVVVDAGATWRSVLAVTLPHGLTPPVLTDYLDLSVGGTLSVGGIGGTSYRYGVQTDQVISLDAAVGDPGTVLAGLGQTGIISRATLRLVPAPLRVRRYTVDHPSVTSMMAAQRQLVHDGRFDFVQGQMVPGDSGWRHVLDIASYYTPPAEPLDYPGEQEDVSYAEFVDRLAPGVAHLESTGDWQLPHPWWNGFLPDTAADGFVSGLATELSVEDIGPGGLVLVYPIFTAPLTTPLFRVPDEPVVFLVAVLRTCQPDAVQCALADNRRWYDTARALGGTLYPSSAVAFTRDDWVAHFGDRWPELAAAKRTHDPDGILGAGVGMFA
jgi:FAD/FMN-containing dehydrogenase